MGVVPTEGRGDLPKASLCGKSLVSLASAALSQAGVAQITRSMSWSSVQDMAVPVVLHDPLCPLTPASTLTDALAAADAGHVVVGYRPVTDTIKAVTAGRVGQTVRREHLLGIASPVVLPASVVAALDRWPDTSDVAAMVTMLRARFSVRFVEVPPRGRRVEDPSALLLLEAFAELHPT